MSLESAVAALTAATNALLALPDQITQLALAKIQAIGQAYQDAVASGDRIFYINQATGNDANSGAPGAPLKTINRAVALTPRNGNCVCNVLAAYNFDANVVLDGHRLVIQGSGTRPVLTFNKYSFQSNTGQTVRATRSIRMVGHAESVVFQTVSLVMPQAVGGEAALAEDREAAIVASVGDINSSQCTVVFSDCNISTYTDRYGPLISVAGALALFYVITNDGSRANIKGRIFRNVTDDAGVAPSTLSLWRSNLSLV